MLGSTIIKSLIGNLLEKLGSDLLGTWNLAENIEINSFSPLDIELKNLPIPQIIFEVADLPFIVIYSNIRQVKVFLKTDQMPCEENPLNIEAWDLDLQIRLASLDEWDSKKWCKRLLKSKRKKILRWYKYVSPWSTHKVANQISQSLETSIVNSLNIKLHNIHCMLIDDHLGPNPFAIEILTDSFYISSVDDSKTLSQEELQGKKSSLLQFLWIRFYGFRVIFRKFDDLLLTSVPKNVVTKLVDIEGDTTTALGGDDDETGPSGSNIDDSSSSNNNQDGFFSKIAKNLLPIFFSSDKSERQKMSFMSNFLCRLNKQDSSQFELFREFTEISVGSKEFSHTELPKHTQNGNSKFIKLPEDPSCSIQMTKDQGVELHILFKRWDIRALNASSTMFGTIFKDEEQYNRYISSREWKASKLIFLPSSEKHLERPPSVEDFPDETFEITCTEDIVSVLYNFINYFNQWSSFLKASQYVYSNRKTHEDLERYLSSIISYNKGSKKNGGPSNIPKQLLTEIETEISIRDVIALNMSANEFLKDGFSSKGSGFWEALNRNSKVDPSVLHSFVVEKVLGNSTQDRDHDHGQKKGTQDQKFWIPESKQVDSMKFSTFNKWFSSEGKLQVTIPKARISIIMSDASSISSKITPVPDWMRPLLFTKSTNEGLVGKISGLIFEFDMNMLSDKISFYHRQTLMNISRLEIFENEFGLVCGLLNKSKAKCSEKNSFMNNSLMKIPSHAIKIFPITFLPSVRVLEIGVEDRNFLQNYSRNQSSYFGGQAKDHAFQDHIETFTNKSFEEISGMNRLRLVDLDYNEIDLNDKKKGQEKMKAKVGISFRVHQLFGCTVFSDSKRQENTPIPGFCPDFSYYLIQDEYLPHFNLNSLEISGFNLHDLKSIWKIGNLVPHVTSNINSIISRSHKEEEILLVKSLMEMINTSSKDNMIYSIRLNQFKISSRFPNTINSNSRYSIRNLSLNKHLHDALSISKCLGCNIDPRVEIRPSVLDNNFGITTFKVDDTDLSGFNRRVEEKMEKKVTRIISEILLSPENFLQSLKTYRVMESSQSIFRGVTGLTLNSSFGNLASYDYEEEEVNQISESLLYNEILRYLLQNEYFVEENVSFTGIQIWISGLSFQIWTSSRNLSLEMEGLILSMLANNVQVVSHDKRRDDSIDDHETLLLKIQETEKNGEVSKKDLRKDKNRNENRGEKEQVLEFFILKSVSFQLFENQVDFNLSRISLNVFPAVMTLINGYELLIFPKKSCIIDLKRIFENIKSFNKNKMKVNREKKNDFGFLKSIKSSTLRLGEISIQIYDTEYLLYQLCLFNLCFKYTHNLNSRHRTIINLSLGEIFIQSINNILLKDQNLGFQQIRKDFSGRHFFTPSVIFSNLSGHLIPSTQIRSKNSKNRFPYVLVHSDNIKQNLNRIGTELNMSQDPIFHLEIKIRVKEGVSLDGKGEEEKGLGGRVEAGEGKAIGVTGTEEVEREAIGVAGAERVEDRGDLNSNLGGAGKPHIENGTNKYVIIISSKLSNGNFFFTDDEIIRLKSVLHLYKKMFNKFKEDKNILWSSDFVLERESPFEAYRLVKLNENENSIDISKDQKLVDKYLVLPESSDFCRNCGGVPSDLMDEPKNKDEYFVEFSLTFENFYIHLLVNSDKLYKNRLIDNQLLEIHREAIEFSNESLTLVRPLYCFNDQIYDSKIYNPRTAILTAESVGLRLNFCIQTSVSTQCISNSNSNTIVRRLDHQFLSRSSVFTVPQPYDVRKYVREWKIKAGFKEMNLMVVRNGTWGMLDFSLKKMNLKLIMHLSDVFEYRNNQQSNDILKGLFSCIKLIFKKEATRIVKIKFKIRDICIWSILYERIISTNNNANTNTITSTVDMYFTKTSSSLDYVCLSPLKNLLSEYSSSMLPEYITIDRKKKNLSQNSIDEELFPSWEYGLSLPLPVPFNHPELLLNSKPKIFPVFGKRPIEGEDFEHEKRYKRSFKTGKEIYIIPIITLKSNEMDFGSSSNMSSPISIEITISPTFLSMIPLIFRQLIDISFMYDKFKTIHLDESLLTSSRRGSSDHSSLKNRSMFFQNQRTIQDYKHGDTVTNLLKSLKNIPVTSIEIKSKFNTMVVIFPEFNDMEMSDSISSKYFESYSKGIKKVEVDAGFVSSLNLGLAGEAESGAGAGAERKHPVREGEDLNKNNSMIKSIDKGEDYYYISLFSNSYHPAIAFSHNINFLFLFETEKDREEEEVLEHESLKISLEISQLRVQLPFVKNIGGDYIMDEVGGLTESRYLFKTMGSEDNIEGRDPILDIFIPSVNSCFVLSRNIQNESEVDTNLHISDSFGILFGMVNIPIVFAIDGARIPVMDDTFILRNYALRKNRGENNVNVLIGDLEKGSQEEGMELRGGDLNGEEDPCFTNCMMNKPELLGIVINAVGDHFLQIQANLNNFRFIFSLTTFSVSAPYIQRISSWWNDIWLIRMRYPRCEGSTMRYFFVDTRSDAINISSFGLTAKSTKFDYFMEEEDENKEEDINQESCYLNHCERGFNWRCVKGTNEVYSVNKFDYCNFEITNPLFFPLDESIPIVLALPVTACLEDQVRPWNSLEFKAKDASVIQFDERLKDFNLEILIDERSTGLSSLSKSKSFVSGVSSTALGRLDHTQDHPSTSYTRLTKGENSSLKFQSVIKLDPFLVCNCVNRSCLSRINSNISDSNLVQNDLAEFNSDEENPALLDYRFSVRIKEEAGVAEDIHQLNHEQEGSFEYFTSAYPNRISKSQKKGGSLLNGCSSFKQRISSNNYSIGILAKDEDFNSDQLRTTNNDENFKRKVARRHSTSLDNNLVNFPRRRSFSLFKRRFSNETGYNNQSSHHLNLSPINENDHHQVNSKSDIRLEKDYNNYNNGIEEERIFKFQLSLSNLEIWFHRDNKKENMSAISRENLTKDEIDQLTLEEVAIDWMSKAVHFVPASKNRREKRRNNDDIFKIKILDHHEREVGDSNTVLKERGYSCQEEEEEEEEEEEYDDDDDEEFAKYVQNHEERYDEFEDLDNVEEEEVIRSKEPVDKESIKIGSEPLGRNKEGVRFFDLEEYEKDKSSNKERRFILGLGRTDHGESLRSRKLFTNSYEIFEFRRNISTYDQADYDYIIKSNRYGRRQELAVHRYLKPSYSSYYIPNNGIGNGKLSNLPIRSETRLQREGVAYKIRREDVGVRGLKTSGGKESQFMNGTAFSILLSLEINTEVMNENFQFSGECNEMRILPGFPVRVKEETLVQFGVLPDPFLKRKDARKKNCVCNYCRITALRRYLYLHTLNGRNIYLSLSKTVPDYIKRDFLLFINHLKIFSTPSGIRKSNLSNYWTSYQTETEMVINEVSISVSMDILQEIKLFINYYNDVKDSILYYSLAYSKSRRSYISPEAILNPYYLIQQNSSFVTKSLRIEGKGRVICVGDHENVTCYRRSLLSQVLPTILCLNRIGSNLGSFYKEDGGENEVSDEKDVNIESRDVSSDELSVYSFQSSKSLKSSNSLQESQVILLYYLGFPISHSNMNYYIPESVKRHLKQEGLNYLNKNRRFGIYAVHSNNSRQSSSSGEVSKDGELLDPALGVRISSEDNNNNKQQKALISENTIYSVISNLIKYTSLPLDWIFKGLKNQSYDKGIPNLLNRYRFLSLLKLPKSHFDKIRQLIFEYRLSSFNIVIHNDNVDILKLSIDNTRCQVKFPEQISCRLTGVVSVITHDPIMDCMITIVRPFPYTLEMSLLKKKENNEANKMSSNYKNISFDEIDLLNYYSSSRSEIDSSPTLEVDFCTESISLELTSGFLQNLRLILSDFKNSHLLGLVYAYERRISSVRIINDIGQSFLIIQPISVLAYESTGGGTGTGETAIGVRVGTSFEKKKNINMKSVKEEEIRGLRNFFLESGDYCSVSIKLPVYMAVEKFTHRKGQKAAARIQANRNSDYSRRLGLSLRDQYHQNNHHHYYLEDQEQHFNGFLNITSATKNSRKADHVKKLKDENDSYVINLEEEEKEEQKQKKEQEKKQEQGKGGTGGNLDGLDRLNNDKCLKNSSGVILNDIVNELCTLGIAKRKKKLGVKHLWLEDKKSELLYGSTGVAESELRQLAEQLELATPALGITSEGVEMMIHRFLISQSTWSSIGKLKDDTLYRRAYRLGILGFLLVLEPESGTSPNEWIWTLGTCVQIENATNTVFRVTANWRHGIRHLCGAIFTEPSKRNNREREPFSMDNGGRRGSSSNPNENVNRVGNINNKNDSIFEKNYNLKNGRGNHKGVDDRKDHNNISNRHFPYIDIPPYSRRSIPLSWFLLSDMEPSIVPILSHKDIVDDNEYSVDKDDIFGELSYEDSDKDSYGKEGYKERVVFRESGESSDEYEYNGCLSHAIEENKKNKALNKDFKLINTRRDDRKDRVNNIGDGRLKCHVNKKVNSLVDIKKHIHNKHNKERFGGAFEKVDGGREKVTVDEKSVLRIQSRLHSIPFTILKMLIHEIMATQPGNVTKAKLANEISSLTFESLMAFSCQVECMDIPTSDKYVTSYSYSIKLTPLLKVTNSLPFPIQIRLKMSGGLKLPAIVGSALDDVEFDIPNMVDFTENRLRSLALLENPPPPNHSATTVATVGIPLVTNGFGSKFRATRDWRKRLINKNSDSNYSRLRCVYRREFAALIQFLNGKSVDYIIQSQQELELPICRQKVNLVVYVNGSPLEYCSYPLFTNTHESTDYIQSRNAQISEFIYRSEHISISFPFGSTITQNVSLRRISGNPYNAWNPFYSQLLQNFFGNIGNFGREKLADAISNFTISISTSTKRILFSALSRVENTTDSIICLFFNDIANTNNSNNINRGNTDSRNIKGSRSIILKKKQEIKKEQQEIRDLEKGDLEEEKQKQEAHLIGIEKKDEAQEVDLDLDRSEIISLLSTNYKIVPLPPMYRFFTSLENLKNMRIGSFTLDFFTRNLRITTRIRKGSISGWSEFNRMVSGSLLINYISKISSKYDFSYLGTSHSIKLPLTPISELKRQNNEEEQQNVSIGAITHNNDLLSQLNCPLVSFYNKYEFVSQLPFPIVIHRFTNSREMHRTIRTNHSKPLDLESDMRDASIVFFKNTIQADDEESNHNEGDENLNHHTSSTQFIYKGMNSAFGNENSSQNYHNIEHTGDSPAAQQTSHNKHINGNFETKPRKSTKSKKKYYRFSSKDLKLPPKTSLSYDGVLLRPNERRPYHGNDPNVWICKPIIEGSSEPLQASKEFSLFSGHRLEYTPQLNKFQIVLHPQYIHPTHHKQQQDHHSINGVSQTVSGAHSNVLNSNTIHQTQTNGGENTSLQISISNSVSNNTSLPSSSLNESENKNPLLITIQIIPAILGTAASGSTSLRDSAYFVIFSLAEAPFFEICNLSNYYIAYDTPEISKSHNYYYRSKKAVLEAVSVGTSQLEDFSRTMTNSNIEKSSANGGNTHTKSKKKTYVNHLLGTGYVYPDIFSAKSADISVIPPKTRIPYIPKNWDCEFIGIRPFNVRKSVWTTHSVTSIKDQISVISFIKLNENITKTNSNQINVKHLSGTNQSHIQDSAKASNRFQNPFASMNTVTNNGLNNMQNKPKTGKLYVFLMVNSKGTRVLTIMDSRKYAEKLLNGSILSISNKSFWDDSNNYGDIENIINERGEDKDNLISRDGDINPRRKYQKTNQLPVRQSASLNNNNNIGKSGDNLGENNYSNTIANSGGNKLLSGRWRKISWIGFKISFFIPRTSISWIHQNELVLVTHGSLFHVSASILPQNIYPMSVLNIVCNSLMNICYKLVGFSEDKDYHKNPKIGSKIEKLKLISQNHLNSSSNSISNNKRNIMALFTNRVNNLFNNSNKKKQIFGKTMKLDGDSDSQFLYGSNMGEHNRIEYIKRKGQKIKKRLIDRLLNGENNELFSHHGSEPEENNEEMQKKLFDGVEGRELTGGVYNGSNNYSQEGTLDMKQNMSFTSISYNSYNKTITGLDDHSEERTFELLSETIKEIYQFLSRNLNSIGGSVSPKENPVLNNVLKLLRKVYKDCMSNEKYIKKRLSSSKNYVDEISRGEGGTGRRVDSELMILGSEFQSQSKRTLGQFFYKDNDTNDFGNINNQNFRDLNTKYYEIYDGVLVSVINIVVLISSYMENTLLTSGKIILNLGLSSIHIDHFLPGDIPVILKTSTNNQILDRTENIRQIEGFEMTKFDKDENSGTQINRVNDSKLSITEDFDIDSDKEKNNLELKIQDYKLRKNKLNKKSKASKGVDDDNMMEDDMNFNSGFTSDGNDVDIGYEEFGSNSEGIMVNRYSRGNNSGNLDDRIGNMNVSRNLESKFFSLTISRSLMSPVYAPIFDEINITVSQICCNLERLVVQTLYFMISKEIENMNIITYSRQKTLWMHSTRQKMVKKKSHREMNYLGSLVCYVSGGYGLPIYITRTPWDQLKIGKPLYIRTLKISDIIVTITIRTSDDTIDIDTLTPEALLFMNILPLDTPHMILNVSSLNKDALVVDIGEFFHFLVSSYSRQLKRRVLPSLGVTHLVAIYSGMKRGFKALFIEIKRGIMDDDLTFVEGFIQGFRVGLIHFFRYILGGAFQTASVIFNFGHKLLGGRRPRPKSILDAIWNGIVGMFMDTFITPWILLYRDPMENFRKTNKKSVFVLTLIFAIVRIALSSLFGALNFFASITESLATTLIGDFEQFVHVKSRAELMHEIEKDRIISQDKEEKKLMDQNTDDPDFSDFESERE
ncbi:uncharacterized protein ELE39_001864 [Cryptosporidium sp. chipmunk genotype I]|uniref:uncharacterized protein n=1 Tax=Cryptosporidium sp. chipmunk genotype I TaxID=1280935 RepID=UPI00351A0C09|nr:hypothetical protein ELE39_001864 [Cryptosporidium sp. chipmunk genotype I]